MENYSYSSYPDSGHSSPRSREIEFENPPPWGEVDPAAANNNNYKVKFMCSYGGKILPRPHDNQLCYVGGETKILAVDRATKLPALLSKLSSLSDYDVSFKYQLPGEDLDALISVSNDDDLDHMMHEYDRLYRASGRPARMRLFLFQVGPTNPGGFGSDNNDGRSDRDRFVEALNSGLTTAQPDSNPKPPPVRNNVDFLFGSGVASVVSPPPPPVPTVSEHVAPPPEFHVRPGHVERVIGSDPVGSPVEFQRQLQRLQIGEEQQQQAVYRRKSDENLVGGYGGASAGDYYVQKPPEKATMAPTVGYWTENKVESVGFPRTGAPEQPMYMITSSPGGGAVYHAQPPMVRPVTGPLSGPAGQGYYHVQQQQQQQQRMGSEVYREQPVYNVVTQPLPQQQQQQQQSTFPPQPPKYVATYAESTPYAQVAYDSATGRQVYYTAPGGIVQQQQHQQQTYQAVGPAGVSAVEMRVAGGLGQQGKVVGSKVPEASV